MNTDKSKKNTRKKSTLSIVIPTLGGKCLAATLKSINSGSLKPDRIYICIPSNYASEVKYLITSNIEVFITKSKGQVAQRAEGLARADADYIVQLDDDILLDQHCLERLLEAIEKTNSAAISPAFTNLETGLSLYLIDSESLIKKIYYWILNGKIGYKPGVITRAGTCFGINGDNTKQDMIEVEWLPGGCVIYKKENIIMDNYYPFSGKAYSEDLYFSELAKTKGLKLFICPSACCQVELMPSTTTMAFPEFKQYITSDMQARKNYVIETDRSLFRMYIFYLVIIMQYLICQCKRSL